MVEAAVRGVDPALAREKVASFSERALTNGTPLALGQLARVRALLAADDEAEALYRRAISLLNQSRSLSQLARTRLPYGEWLRWANRRADAREQLRTAEEMFAAMGALGFGRRARLELAATGEHARKRTVDTMGDLTPQETRVARLASQGATNAEIGARLFISSNTVDYHLRKVYRSSPSPREGSLHAPWLIRKRMKAQACTSRHYLDEEGSTDRTSKHESTLTGLAFQEHGPDSLSPTAVARGPGRFGSAERRRRRELLSGCVAAHGA